VHYPALANIAVEQGDVMAALNQITYVQQHDPEYIRELEKAHGPMPELPLPDIMFADELAEPAPARPRKVSPTVAGPKGMVYQLKITLHGSKPPIWRRIQVPGDISLGKLHDVIQVAMGWLGGHLHAFEIGPDSYSDRESGLEDAINETRTKLHQVADEKSKFTYTYDFGDNWEHDILVEKVLPPEKGKHYPICMTGKRAAPLEDSGGIWGYYDILDILQDPNDPEHEEMLEWAGGPIDPEAFSCDEINDEFKQMKL
jgi:hypothetical protein